MPNKRKPRVWRAWVFVMKANPTIKQAVFHPMSVKAWRDAGYEAIRVKITEEPPKAKRKP